MLVPHLTAYIEGEHYMQSLTQIYLEEHNKILRGKNH